MGLSAGRCTTMIIVILLMNRSNSIFGSIISGCSPFGIPPQVEQRKKAIAVVDYLDFYLNGGQLLQTDNYGTRQAMISNIAAASGDNRFSLGVYAAGMTAEFMTQK